MSEALQVSCPTCRRRGPWLDGDWKPFCSERCRLIDLGSWFAGRHAISEPLRPDHFAEFAEASGDLDKPDPADDGQST
ncbi:MAG: DNA gyrase inhibitor YacG [Opitutaceae bacterium]|nr:DNA gyrase inhibitor YacG [Opitutaceae bacterium]